MEITTSQSAGEQVEKTGAVSSATSVSDTPPVVEEEEDLSEFGVPSLAEMEEMAKKSKSEDEPEEKEVPKEVVPPASEAQAVAETKPEAKPAEGILAPPVSAPEAQAVEQVSSPNQKEYAFSSIDKRIVQLYSQAMALQGKEIPTREEFTEVFRGQSFKEKEELMHSWIKAVSQMKGEEAPKLTEDDANAIAEARAEEILAEREREQRETAWRQNIINTVAEHPELDEASPSYNPAIEKPVTKLVEGGMLASEAYSLIANLAVKKQEEEVKKQEEVKKIEKQRDLSGIVSQTSASKGDGARMTWEEFDALRDSDPEKYDKLNDLRLKGKFQLLEDED